MFYKNPTWRIKYTKDYIPTSFAYDIVVKNRYQSIWVEDTTFTTHVRPKFVNDFKSTPYEFDRSHERFANNHILPFRSRVTETPVLKVRYLTHH